MSAGVPSEAMWPLPPLPSDSPGAPRATRSQAVSSDSGAWGRTHVDLSVQGMMGEECQPHCCHWQQCGHSVTGAAATVMRLWLSGPGGRDRQGSPGDCLQAFWLPRKGWGSMGPIFQHRPLRRGLGDLRGWCVRRRVQTSPGVVGRGLSGVWDPIGRVGPVRRQVTESSTHPSRCEGGLCTGVTMKRNCCLQTHGPGSHSQWGKGPTWNQSHSHRVGGAGS